MTATSRTTAIIVAAGRGTRAGPGVPKQWRSLRDRTVLAHTLDALRGVDAIADIVLVLHPDDMDLAAGYLGLGDVAVAAGGATRRASVRAGLESLADDPPELVLIHDVARPCVGRDLIGRVIDALADADAAAPALSVRDALWQGDGDMVTGVQDRTGLFRAQTPQGFRFGAILNAHRAHLGDAADDVAVARAAGLDVRMVAGDEDNLKITDPGDFARAEAILERRMPKIPDIRTGNGFDVHAFTDDDGDGDGVTLCGLHIPHERSLKGHSDADVGLHTITDAIYGALCAGDIGQHFPPSDPQWKGADSAVFLAHARDLAAGKGFTISHVDLTLICETPKIGPHAADMRAHVAYLLQLSPERVSVKATTSERLGFTGRGEGIAAMATATLVGGA